MNSRHTLSVLLVLIITSILFTSCGEKDQSEIGDAHFQKGEYKEAVTAYNEFLSLKPSNETALYNRGRAYEELGMYDKALKDFKAVLKTNPRNINAYLSIGKDFYRNEDYANAAFQFEKAYKLNEKNEQATLLLARAFHKSGEIDKAMEFYDKAITLDKDYAEAYMYRGALKIFLKQNSGCSDIKRAKNLGYEQAASLYKQYCE